MKLLMVCLGNICRSPMAEGVMRKLTQDIDFFVDSAGTANYHIGENPDPRMIRTALKHNINISKLKARKFLISDFDDFDIIFTMDSSNYQTLFSLARNESDQKKIKMISEKQDIPDPYYEGTENFEKVYQLLKDACKKFLNKIEKR